MLQNLFYKVLSFQDLQAFETFFFRFELWQETDSIKGGLVVVFSLGSSPTVETENQAKRLQPNINGPRSGFRFNGIWEQVYIEK